MRVVLFLTNNFPISWRSLSFIWKNEWKNYEFCELFFFSMDFYQLISLYEFDNVCACVKGNAKQIDTVQTWLLLIMRGANIHSLKFKRRNWTVNTRNVFCTRWTICYGSWMGAVDFWWIAMDKNQKIYNKRTQDIRLSFSSRRNEMFRMNCRLLNVHPKKLQRWK